MHSFYHVLALPCSLIKFIVLCLCIVSLVLTRLRGVAILSMRVGNDLIEFSRTWNMVSFMLPRLNVNNILFNHADLIMDSSLFIPVFVVTSTAYAVAVSIMSATSTSSPQRKLAMFGSVNTSPKLKSTEMSPPRSSNWLWTSPSRKSVTSPPKRVSTSPTFDLGQDSAALNGSSNNTQRGKAKHHVVHKPHVATQSPKSPTVQETQPSSLSHPADSPHWIRLGPRISNGSKSNHKHGHGACDTFFTEEPKSILHSRRYSYRHLTAGSSSSNDSSSCTMTPTVMFSTEVDHQQIQNSSKRQEQQFHQSPHWTGKVRINPFSPVPPKYLEPPSSTKSLPHMNSYFGLPVLSSKSLSPLQLTSKHSGARRSRRLKPKGGTFPPILDDNVSPTDVTEDPFGVEPSGKRKSETVLGLPQSVNEDIEPPHKQIKLSRSRYLSDFEEVRHLGSGSFGSVNACLSRLDGCMYAIKSVSPQGIERSSLSGYSSRFDSGGLYGRSKNSSSDLPPVPPTPRRDVSLTPMRKKWFSHTAASGDTEDDSGGMASGTKHWTDTALKRMLREVSWTDPFQFSTKLSIILLLTRIPPRYMHWQLYAINPTFELFIL